MMRILTQEQNSAFAYWLSQSAYPIVITLHSLGMALLVGLLTVISLRVLGVAAGLPIGSLRRFMAYVWLGFWINAASGTLLFLISPVKFLHSGLFICKLSFIAAGLITGGIMSAAVLNAGDEFSTAQVSLPPRVRMLAALTLLCWLCAIISGRLLAYSTFSDVGIGGAS
jgi:hypothetical protein